MVGIVSVVIAGTVSFGVGMLTGWWYGYLSYENDRDQLYSNSNDTSIVFES